MVNYNLLAKHFYFVQLTSNPFYHFEL